MPLNNIITEYERNTIHALNGRRIATAHISADSGSISVTMNEVETDVLNSQLDDPFGIALGRRDSYQTWKNVITGNHFSETLNNLRTRGIRIPENGIDIYMHTGNTSNQALASQNAITLKADKPSFMEYSVPADVGGKIRFYHFQKTRQSMKEKYREALIVHEIGHLMHAQTSPDLYSELKIGNQEMVNLSPEERLHAEKELGEYSTHNRLEFIAEAFTAMAYGKDLSDENIETYIKWGGCTEIIPDEKLLKWASKGDRINDFQNIEGSKEERAKTIWERIREGINKRNKTLTYEDVMRGVSYRPIETEEESRLETGASETREIEESEPRPDRVPTSVEELSEEETPDPVQMHPQSVHRDHSIEQMRFHEQNDPQEKHTEVDKGPEL